MKMTEARKEYLKEYKKEKLKRVPLEMPHEMYTHVLQHSALQGESVNGFIRRAIQETMERDHNPGTNSDEKSNRFRESLRALSNAEEAAK